MKITSFGDLKYDLKLLASAERYFRKYYHGPLIRGQGIEQLLDVLTKYSVPGSWLDLGSGASTLLWSIPLNGITSITVSDKYPEMLLTLRNFVEGEEVPECYRNVLEFCGRDEAHLIKMRSRLHGYFVIDALRPWHGDDIADSFDLVTEFGCFGIAPSAEAFVNCLGYAKPAIKPRGIFIGANWIRSKHFVTLYGGANDYLSTGLIQQAAELHDMELLHSELATIQGDPDYVAVVIWVMREREKAS